MLRLIIGRAIRVAVLAAAVPTLVLSQAGRIVGTVTDGAGKPLVGAQILVSATGLSAESGDDGRFAISGVPGGKYDLKAYHIGHRAKTVTGIVVIAGKDATVAVSKLWFPATTPVLLDAFDVVVPVALVPVEVVVPAPP